MSNLKEAKVTGIGGIFFKSKDPKATKDWYEEHLGIPMDQYGHMFQFIDPDQPDEKAHLQLSVFSNDTKYFDPSEKDFMINYRVQNLEVLAEQLKKNGVKLVDEIATYSYGKFLHIMDEDGNNIELWEPIDEGFEESESSD